MTHIYPVIHYSTFEHTFAQAEKCINQKVDGIFLISHNGNDYDLIPTANAIKALYDIKIGVNMLGSSDILQVYDDALGSLCVDMVWFDNCGVSSKGVTPEGRALSDMAIKHPDVEVFAAVAFKYQKTEERPTLAAAIASSYKFIATTSGSGTGKSPELAKIQMMSYATDGKLAVASGMTVENVRRYTPYLSHILVATGISSDFHTIDETLLEQFVKEVRSNTDGIDTSV